MRVVDIMELYAVPASQKMGEKLSKEDFLKIVNRHQQAESQISVDFRNPELYVADDFIEV